LVFVLLPVVVFVLLLLLVFVLLVDVAVLDDSGATTVTVAVRLWRCCSPSPFGHQSATFSAERVTFTSIDAMPGFRTTSARATVTSLLPPLLPALLPLLLRSPLRAMVMATGPPQDPVTVTTAWVAFATATARYTRTCTTNAFAGSLCSGAEAGDTLPVMTGTTSVIATGATARSHTDFHTPCATNARAQSHPNEPVFFRM
jgi:hypothetical protein